MRLYYCTLEDLPDMTGLPAVRPREHLPRTQLTFLSSSSCLASAPVARGYRILNHGPPFRSTVGLSEPGLLWLGINTGLPPLVTREECRTTLGNIVSFFMTHL